MPSGEKKTCLLPLRGNRRHGHAIHMAAITQIWHKHSDGRASCERKTAAGKTRKEALRCLIGGSATPSTPASRPTPNPPRAL
jgi:hypothetical protein